MPGITGTANTVSFQSITDAARVIVFRNGGFSIGSDSGGAAAVFRYK